MTTRTVAAPARPTRTPSPVARASIVDDAAAALVGRLRQALRASGVVVGTPDELPAADRVVVVYADWDATVASGLTALVEGGAEVLPVRCDGALTLIGPYLVAGRPGCLACAERWRSAGPPGGVPAGGALAMAGLVPPAFAATVGALVLDALADRAPVVRALRVDEATVSLHPVRPVGGCPACALPTTVDGPAIDLESVPVEPGQWRAANPLATNENLRAELLDRRLGPVRRLYRPWSGPLALAVAEIGLDDGPGRWESGYGRAVTQAEADRIALFEAVERYCGFRPWAGRTRRRATFAELGPDRAVDPDRVGRHDPAYAGHPASRVRPYTVDTALSWVDGWSLTRQRPVAVPEQLAYWGGATGADRVLFETSNGCGLGASRTEAILHAVSEVVERDTFLMAWYSQSRLAPVDPAGDPQVEHLIDHLDGAGFDTHIFDTTNDLGLPAVLCLLAQRDPRPGRAAALFAAGAHPDPRGAIRAAIGEAAVGAIAAARLTPESAADQADRARAMAADPTRVATMADHADLYRHPLVADRYAHLLDHPTPPRSPAEIWPAAGPVTDLRDQLLSTVDSLAAVGLEVIVVDQTEPHLAARLGLHAVKVIIPGTLPMTFGHVHHRTLGLPRLLDVPARLGRAPVRTGHHELVLHPHPFP